MTEKPTITLQRYSCHSCMSGFQRMESAAGLTCPYCGSNRIGKALSLSALLLMLAFLFMAVLLIGWLWLPPMLTGR